jgi:hypothetical protein
MILDTLIAALTLATLVAIGKIMGRTRNTFLFLALFALMLSLIFLPLSVLGGSR